MSNVDKIFVWYDQYVSTFPPSTQAIISAILFIFFIFNILAFIKSGKWIFFVIFILALPGTWPATKQFIEIAWSFIKGLFYRI